MTGILLAAAVLLQSGQAPAAVQPLPYQTLFYSSEGLKLEAYLFTPEGPGPFPLVVYNHGSRIGDERLERPVGHVPRLLLPLGYAVLVPERRGYGKSEGQTFSEDIGADRGAKFVARMDAETRDVLAAVDYVTRDPALHIDAKRMAMMGWSFGGMVTTLAMGRDQRFAAGAVQAPAAANWIGKSVVQAALLKAARAVQSPMQCAVAENDTQTESTRAICEAVHAKGIATELKIYPAYTPPPPAPGTTVRPPGPNAPAPGHAIFAPAGMAVWGDDLVAFLRKHLAR
jgi:dienelactone hydrolase